MLDILKDWRRRGGRAERKKGIRFSPEVTFAFRTRLLRYGRNEEQSKENKDGEKEEEEEEKKKKKKRKGRQRGTQSTTTETIRGAG